MQPVYLPAFLLTERKGEIKRAVYTSNYTPYHSSISSIKPHKKKSPIPSGIGLLLVCICVGNDLLTKDKVGKHAQCTE